ncbi:MAG: hypothetical protein ACI35P_16040 [Bacillus sp. (in: firmicutes)]
MATAIDIKEYALPKSRYELEIGDPMYFEESREEQKRLTLQQTFQKVDGKLYTYMEDDIAMASIWFIPKKSTERFAFKEAGHNGYRVNAKYKDKLKVVTQDLGCDTAQYMINGYTVDTAADGYYGRVLTFKVGNSKLGTLIILDGGLYTTYEDLATTVKAALGLPIR